MVVSDNDGSATLRVSVGLFVRTRTPDTLRVTGKGEEARRTTTFSLIAVTTKRRSDAVVRSVKVQEAILGRRSIFVVRVVVSMLRGTTVTKSVKVSEVIQDRTIISTEATDSTMQTTKIGVRSVTAQEVVAGIMIISIITVGVVGQVR